MSRGRIDLGGGTPSSSAASEGRSKAGKSSKGGDGNKDKVKLIAAAAIGVIAVGLLAYQLVPGMLSSGSTANTNTPELTEPEMPDTSNNVPGSVQEPVIPKPRGSAKRPVGG